MTISADPASAYSDAFWRLDGQRALITGATKGIGAAVAQCLLERGATVFITARTQTDIDRCLLEWAQSNSTPPRLDGVAFDVSQAQERRDLIKAATASMGGLDILVNNVGTNIRRSAGEYSATDIERLMQTNLISAYKLAVLAHPFLCKSQSASVVNMSSVAGQTHVKTGAIYGMTKAAINQLTRNLAGEWGADDIRVNAIAPWYIRTPLAEQVLQDVDYYNSVKERTVLNRVGAVEEIAALVAFLCMPGAAYISGQVIAVDGGMTIKGF